jgi:hypothetical protein
MNQSPRNPRLVWNLILPVLYIVALLVMGALIYLLVLPH